MTTTSTTNKLQLKPLAKIPKLLPSHIPVTDDDTVTCAICLEESDECISRFVKKRVETSCGHHFHRSCLDKWCYAHTKGWTYGVIPCPACRGEIYIDDGSDKKMFAWLVGCNCCTRHQENRPSVYAYDEDVDNRVMSAAEEEALRTLSADEYIDWRRANNRRRQDDRNFCDCSCRNEVRAIIRRIANPK
jgi:hypothetical protein